MEKKEELRKEIIKLNNIILNQKALIQQLSEDNAGLVNTNVDLQCKIDATKPSMGVRLIAKMEKGLENERNSWRALATSYADQIFSLQLENRAQIAKRVIATERLEEHREKLRNEVAEKDYYITQLEAALEAAKVI